MKSQTKIILCELLTFLDW